MAEALVALETQGLHLDTLRLRAFPFADEVVDFINAHDQVFVIEQNRDAQMRMLLVNECATDPAEVYELAKRRGMDFVTLTDHDTIDGALELAHLPDTFISEELTARFRGEPQAVHVLCLGVTPEDDLTSCGRYAAVRSFGPVGYRMTAISDHAMARHRAADTYYGYVTPDPVPDTWT